MAEDEQHEHRDHRPAAKEQRSEDETPDAPEEVLASSVERQRSTGEDLRGSAIAEQYTQLHPGVRFPDPDYGQRLLRSIDPAVFERAASVFNGSAAIQSMVTALEAAGKFPDSGIARMLSQIGRSSEQVARLLPPDSLGNVSSAVQSLADVYARNPALRDLAQSASPALSSSLTSLGKVIAESGIYTKKFFDEEGTLSAFRKMVLDSIGAQPSRYIFTDAAFTGLRTALTEDAEAKVRSLSSLLDADDIASIAQRALTAIPYDTLASAYERLEDADLDDDDDEFEGAAVRALREVDEHYDPDAPSTAEQIAATQAFLRLVVALRPDLSDDPALREKVKWVARGGGAVFCIFLLIYYAPVFYALGTLLFILEFGKSSGDIADRALSPGAYREQQDADSDKDQDSGKDDD